MKTNSNQLLSQLDSSFSFRVLSSCFQNSTSSNEISVTGALSCSNSLIKEGVASDTTPTWTSNNTSQVITYSITRISNGTNIAVPPSITIDSTTGKVTVTSNPTRAGHNTAETVLYSLKKPGNSVPSSISIHQTTGIVTVSTNAVATDSGIYAVLVTGIGSFKDNQRADIDIKVTKP